MAKKVAKKLEKQRAKVLLAAPTSIHKDYCMKDWIKNITQPGFSNLDYDILIVDNSKDKKYHKKIQKELGTRGEVIHLPFNKNRDIAYTIADSNEIIRKYFLDNKYQFLFFNETDVFAPCKAIDYLIYQQEAVIGLPYFVGQHYQSKIITHESVPSGKFRAIALKTFMKAFIDFNGEKTNGMQTGIGAIMINRSILDNVDFTIDESRTNIQSHSDSYFQNRLFEKGIPIMQTNKYICEHRNTNWAFVYKKAEEERK